MFSFEINWIHSCNKYTLQIYEFIISIKTGDYFNRTPELRIAYFLVTQVLKLMRTNSHLPLANLLPGLCSIPSKGRYEISINISVNVTSRKILSENLPIIMWRFYQKTSNLSVMSS